MKGVKKPLRLQLRKKQARAHPGSPKSQIQERANNGALLILRCGRRNALGHQVVAAAPNVLETERLLSLLKERANNGALLILRHGRRNALGQQVVAAAPNVLETERLLSPLKERVKSGASPILRRGRRNALGKKLVAAAPNVLVSDVCFAPLQLLALSQLKFTLFNLLFYLTHSGMSPPRGDDYSSYDYSSGGDDHSPRGDDYSSYDYSSGGDDHSSRGDDYSSYDYSSGGDYYSSSGGDYNYFAWAQKHSAQMKNETSHGACVGCRYQQSRQSCVHS